MTIHSIAGRVAAALLGAAASVGVAHAQSAAGAQSAAPRTATKPAAATAAEARPARTAQHSASANAARDRADNRNAQRQAAAGAQAAHTALTPGELDAASRVHTGRFPCELGQSVEVHAEGRTPGLFVVSLGNQRFRMQPVETTTGALRLEDPKAGGVWLQLANKSMLMNQKLGRRMADECMSPAQVQVAEAMKNAPPINILEPAPVQVAAPAQPVPAAPQVVVSPVRATNVAAEGIPGARD